MMGKNNSSKCRVAPMMNWMLEDKERIVKLLALVGIHISSQQINVQNIFYDGHNGEKGIIPSCEYLCKLIQTLPDNYYAIAKIRKAKQSATKENRLQLAEKNNQAARKEAINRIQTEYSSLSSNFRGDIYLEGSSKPDIFIETKNMIIVVEGKWTESSTTESTLFVEKRNQMVRHLHDTFNYVQVNGLRKDIVGFYIVSEDFARNPKNHISVAAFKEILPGQFGITGYEAKIANAYRGYITWEQIQEEFPQVMNEKEWKKTQ